MPLADLSAEGFAATLYWYGANIHPAAEEKKRREALASLAAGRVPVFVEDTFTPPWMEAASPLAEEPEGGRRCALCFRLQLEGAARAAVREGIPLLCTTLTISPHKDASLINAIGEETVLGLWPPVAVKDFPEAKRFCPLRRHVEGARSLQAVILRLHFQPAKR